MSAAKTKLAPSARIKREVSHGKCEQRAVRLARPPDEESEGGDRLLWRGHRLEDAAVRGQRLRDVGREPRAAGWRDDAPRGSGQDGRAAALDGTRSGRE